MHIAPLAPVGAGGALEFDMEKNKFKILLPLFWETFKLSAFTIGGGYVIVPLMKKKFVEKLGWISEEEMLDYVSMAQSCPGAMAVNASIFVGHKMAGLLGQIVSLAGTVLPPLIILSVISAAYMAFAENPIVKAVLAGMSAGVAAVMLDVVVTMVGKLIKNKDVTSFVLCVCAFMAVAFFDVNIVFVLAVACIFGLIVSSRRKRVGK